MDTLLFVFTSVGAAAEDANVFHADFLLVAGDEPDRQAITSSIARMVGGKVDGYGMVLYPWSDLNLDHDALITEMALDGWQARWVTAGMVVQDE